MQYKISVTAWRESLHGVRLRGLVQEAPHLQITHSSRQPLITLEEERQVALSGWSFQWPIRYYLTPINLPREQRVRLMEQRQMDLYRMHACKGGASAPHSNVHHLSSIKREEFAPDQQRDWQPLSVYKPYAEQSGGKYQRGWGHRSEDKKTVGEMLGGKGFGWKKKRQHMWQGLADRIGHSPNIGY